MRTLEQALAIAHKTIETKYPSALVAFCAGSIIRGEGTATSDIDLVIICSDIKHAWREAFIFEGWPVETFIHDPSTLNYFFSEIDAKSGIIALPQMVADGIVVWGSALEGENFKSIARSIINAGPAPLSSEGVRNRIYMISDLIDDLRAPKSREEAIGTVVRLYDILADFALRSQRHWSGSGKQISRALQRQNPKLHEDFISAFEAFFSKNEADPLFQLAQKLVEPFGGFIFDGYRRDAPEHWKLKRIS